MKKTLRLLSLAALTIGLLGSCAKIDERISNLEKRVDGIEATSIASVQQQIDGIKASITELEAADVTVNGKIDELKATTEAQQTLIDALKEADKALGQKDTELEARIAALEGQVATINGQIKTLEEADKAINDRIDELKTYVDTEIGKTKDWAEETFATLEQYQKTADGLAALSVTVTGISTTLAEVQTSIARLGTKINGIDAALQGKITAAKTELEGKITSLKTELEGKIADAIAASETSLQGWVNKQLEGYYTIAQVDAKVKGLQKQIDNLKKDDETKKKIAELESNLKNLTQDLEKAKATIKAEYDAAIKKAIEENNGTITKTIQSKIDEVNTTIAALTGRVEALESDVATLKNDVDALKAMIQTVSIIPAYNNGSVKAEDGILTINCVITPKEAVESLAKENFTILTSESEVLTKSALYGTLTIAKDEDLVLDKTNGTATIKVDVSSVLPAEEDKALTVAVNIKNGISDFTTEFVPVYVYVAPAPVAPEGFAYLGVKDANGKPLFWAECNLGASNPQDHGDYFAWGETAPYYTTTGGWPATPAWKSGKGNGYAWQSYCGSSSFSEWSTPPYDATSNILKPEFDAATAANSSWRTPTSDEFKALAAGCVLIWTADYNSTGKAGYIVYKAKNNADKGKANINGTWKKWDVSQSNYVTDGASEATGYTTSDTHIFFPAAGYGNGTSLKSAVSSGFYWSSSLNTDGPDRAYCLYFGSGSVNPKNYSTRYFGFSVRPVTSDAAPAPTPLPAGALAGEFSVSATKKVHFSQGNLVATIDATGAPTAWKFATNQYDYIGEGGANKTIGLAAGDVDFFGWSTSTNGGTSTTDNYGIKTAKTVSDYSGDFYDWGKAVGDGSTWRTLTTAEWQYLFNCGDYTSDVRNGKYKWTTVNGVNGYVIAPDGFTGELASSYADDAALASAGNLVFLPAAGARNGSDVFDVGEIGYYWSSTAVDSRNAYGVLFNSFGVYPDSNVNRDYGFSVRLVTESK